jgi:hypothetical protein
MHATHSPLFLHDFFNVPLLETKASIEKAIASILKANGSVAEPFSNGKLANKELVARPAYFLTTCNRQLLIHFVLPLYKCGNGLFHCE